jgi:hypothetical protein
MALQAIGIDLGKTVSHLVGLDLRGEVAVRKQLSRKQWGWKPAVVPNFLAVREGEHERLLI